MQRKKQRDLLDISICQARLMTVEKHHKSRINLEESAFPSCDLSSNILTSDSAWYLYCLKADSVSCLNTTFCRLS